MGGHSEESAGASVVDRATIHVRCSNGNKFLVEAALSSSVGALKVSLVEKSEIPVDRQRLIYKGRVLKDDDSLGSYGLHDGHTIHLVRGAPSLVPVEAVAPPTPTAVPGSAGGFLAASNSSSGGMSGQGVPGSGAFTGGPGFGMSLPEFQQVQQQLMQNPSLIREMMNMPAVQSLVNNPELMRSLIMSNPQMRDVIDRNPDLAHILNDPGTLRQTLDAARNPELMREMMRNTDRAMSNIEASPEGFNMLRRMYETVQEPLLNAATIGTDAGDNLTANPFGGLLGVQSTGPRQLQDIYPTGSASGPIAVTPTAVPNTAPLPNPWNPQRGASVGNVTSEGISVSVPPDFPGLAGLTDGLLGSGLQEFGASAGGRAALDPLTMQEMLQNPTVQQVIQGLLSNPQYIGEVLNLQPHIRVLLNSDPQFREMMQSPHFLRQISTPESVQQMLQLQQGLLGQIQTHSQSQQIQAHPHSEQQQLLSGEPGNIAGLDLSTLQNIFGPLGSSVLSNSLRGTSESAEQLYASQLSQLQDMGFVDIHENVRALTATGGDVHAAVEWLLGNPS